MPEVAYISPTEQGSRSQASIQKAGLTDPHLTGRIDRQGESVAVKKSKVRMSLEHIVPVLDLSIGPVIVISGVGLILLSMTNRFGRTIDRSRKLAAELRNASGSEVHGLQNQLMILIRRARLQRLAITFTSTSLLFGASLVIVLFLAVLLNLEAALLVAGVFIACMGSLIVGLILFIADVNVSLSALKLETDLAYEL